MRENTPSISLPLFLDKEIEHELACAAMIFWPQAVAGRWVDMKEAWKRQVWKATSWRRVGGPAGAVFFDMKHLGIVLPSWHVLKLEDGRMISLQSICPEDVRDNFDQACNRKGWKHRPIGELRQGVWFEPIKALLVRTPSRTWTAKHAAHAK